jgi:predicted secreted protein
MKIALEATPGTGHQSQLVGNGQPQLLQVELPISTPTATEPPPLGAPQTMRLHLRTVRTGTCTVLLEYRRPWETDAPPAATARYRVSVR